MNALTAFCVPGGHPGPVCGTTADGGAVLTGWAMVPGAIWNGQWVYEPGSPAKVYCCAQHNPRAAAERCDNCGGDPDPCENCGKRMAAALPG